MTFRFYVLSILALAGFLATAAMAKSETSFSYDCHGNALEACYLIVEGDIDDGAAERLNAMLEDGVETFQILLNSKGGNLAAGIAMGRVIRKYNLETRIGVYQEMDSPTAGECLSACAYAFLGGTRRFVREGSRIGFHQFALGENPLLEGTGGLVVGQKLSASAIAYMVEMGVDARLFTVASETGFGQMYFPDRPERQQYDVETAVGFGHFTMEPYGDGVVAASKRLGPTHAYDRVDHLTLYCRQGRAFALLTVGGENQWVPEPEDITAGISTSLLAQANAKAWSTLNLDRTAVRTWTSVLGGYIELSFDAASVLIGDDTKWFRAFLGASRAAGGWYGAAVELNQMDRDMLRTALRLCI